MTLSLFLIVVVVLAAAAAAVVATDFSQYILWVCVYICKCVFVFFLNIVNELI